MLIVSAKRVLVLGWPVEPRWERGAWCRVSCPRARDGEQAASGGQSMTSRGVSYHPHAVSLERAGACGEGSRPRTRAPHTSRSGWGVLARRRGDRAARARNRSDAHGASERVSRTETSRARGSAWAALQPRVARSVRLGRRAKMHWLQAGRVRLFGFELGASRRADWAEAQGTPAAPLVSTHGRFHRRPRLSEVREEAGGDVRAGRRAWGTRGFDRRLAVLGGRSLGVRRVRTLISRRCGISQEEWKLEVRVN